MLQTNHCFSSANHMFVMTIWGRYPIFLCLHQAYWYEYGCKLLAWWTGNRRRFILNSHGDCGIRKTLFAEAPEAVLEFAINTRHLRMSGASLSNVPVLKTKLFSEKQLCFHPGNVSAIMVISIGIMQDWRFRGLVTKSCLLIQYQVHIFNCLSMNRATWNPICINFLYFQKCSVFPAYSVFEMPLVISNTILCMFCFKIVAWHTRLTRNMVYKIILVISFFFRLYFAQYWECCSLYFEAGLTTCLRPHIHTTEF